MAKQGDALYRAFEKLEIRTTRTDSKLSRAGACEETGVEIAPPRGEPDVALDEVVPVGVREGAFA